ncbi:MAG: hypothetical protein IPK85_15220 [Gemmatimonadetes bacterium]|nr:hypothetical protein [Gemmatimonadota bacterium]
MTMPVGGFFASGEWAGAATVAIQQIDRANVGSVYRSPSAVPSTDISPASRDAYAW